jgi:nucleotide-binding universal stress UspA family protein
MDQSQLNGRHLMERFMIGLDGSRASEAALRWASRLAVDSGAELLAVYANGSRPSEVPPSDPARELLGEWTRPAEELGVTVRTEVLDGDPRSALSDRVMADPPDLLVLGRSGRGGGPGFLHLGSVVEHAAHHTPCPLAVIPPDSGVAVRRIVVGVDGPDSPAVAWCAEFAAATGAEVLAVSVQEPIAEWTPAWDARNWRREVEREIAEWTAPIVDAGVEVTPIASENLHPADGLLGVASARDADLLVLGTRGAGGFVGLRFGGVAMKVLHGASLPLVLVPPPEE